MTIQLKLRRMKRTENPRIKYNLKMLTNLKVLEVFQVMMGWRFAPLLFLEDPQELEDSMTKELNEVAENVLGRKRKKHRHGSLTQPSYHATNEERQRDRDSKIQDLLKNTELQMQWATRAS